VLHFPHGFVSTMIFCFMGFAFLAIRFGAYYDPTSVANPSLAMRDTISGQNLSVCYWISLPDLLANRFPRIRTCWAYFINHVDASNISTATMPRFSMFAYTLGTSFMSAGHGKRPGAGPLRSHPVLVRGAWQQFLHIAH
jgi:hypothetical protein